MTDFVVLLDHSVPFTGTSANSGDQGAFVGLDAAVVTFDHIGGPLQIEFFDFNFDHLSGPSIMGLDLLLQIQGVDQSPFQRFIPAARMDPTLRRFVRVVPLLQPGQYRFRIMARGVLFNGPPIAVHVGGRATIRCTVQSRTLSFSPQGLQSVDAGSSLAATINLVAPEAAPVTINLESRNGFVTLQPPSITINAGSTSAAFTVIGTTGGNDYVTASAEGFQPGTLTVPVRPVITSVEPGNGPTDTLITVHGLGFSEGADIHIFGYPHYTILNGPTSLSARVSEFSEGPARLYVGVRGGLYSNKLTFEITPSHPASGLYQSERDELRLDVDASYPRMTASGIVHEDLTTVFQWVANLTPDAGNEWTGTLWYRDGNVNTFPFTNVRIRVFRSPDSDRRSVTVTFSGGGVPERVRVFRFVSFFFHSVEFEFDSAEGEAATLEVDTGAHPNHPGHLPSENLSIQRVYQRAGFDVSISTGGGIVPLTGAGPNALWSDQEMHDAMQTYWSRFADRAQWAMWVFFASLHEQGTGLGGIMFDDVGPNHRQGTSIFNDSFISNAPKGDQNPEAWVKRMIFWTACHEMGHAFNLAHSWEKSIGTSWIPLTNQSEARSFMNYPRRVNGGESCFFANFEYRFSDEELLFMRHAPVRFVQMGNADWFDHHAFQGANISSEPRLKLELRVNRERPIFEFMEPVTLELKLTNISSQPQQVEENLLSAADSTTVILKKDRKPARQLTPYAQYCWLSEKRELRTRESVYESLFVSAGRNGWDMAEPGCYTIQVAVDMDGEDLVSNPLRVRVAPPRGYEEEFLAQDFFSDEVGRIIAFDGSRFFTKGNDTLREVTEKLSDRPVALHASLALGQVLANKYKQLVEDPQEPRKQLGIKIQPSQLEEARKLLATALTARMDTAAESFGHIDFKWYVDRFSDWLAQEGATEEAARTQDTLHQTLSTRQVHGRKILDQVLQEIKERRDSYKPKK